MLLQQQQRNHLESAFAGPDATKLRFWSQAAAAGTPPAGSEIGIKGDDLAADDDEMMGMEEGDRSPDEDEDEEEEEEAGDDDEEEEINVT